MFTFTTIGLSVSPRRITDSCMGIPSGKSCWPAQSYENRTGRAMSGRRSTPNVWLIFWPRSKRMRRCCSSLDAADRRSEDTQAEGTYRRAISLSRSSGNSATGGRSHPLFILRTDQIGGSSLAGIESPRSAMLNVRFGEQSQVERAIRRDFAASPTQVATSAQCHTLDGTGK